MLCLATPLVSPSIILDTSCRGRGRVGSHLAFRRPLAKTFANNHEIRLLRGLRELTHLILLVRRQLVHQILTKLMSVVLSFARRLAGPCTLTSFGRLALAATTMSRDLGAVFLTPSPLLIFEQAKYVAK